MSETIWASIREAATAAARDEPLLAPFLTRAVLDHTDLPHALGELLAEKLSTASLEHSSLCDTIARVFREDAGIRESVDTDLTAVVERNPACANLLEPFLYFKGFHGIQTYRAAHALWRDGRRHFALHLQSRASEVFGMDIHPAACIGRGIFIDHGTSIVIGETAVVADFVSMLHEVTLGGTGKQSGDRHPKIGRGVLISAGAKVLGNIQIGEGAKIGAGSVVLEDVPPHSTVVGVPGRVVGKPDSDAPALSMDQSVPTHYDI